MFQPASEAVSEKCPYLINGSEGTTYCQLAEIQAQEVGILRQIIQVRQALRVNFGSPTITGTGIRSDVVASRFLAGDSIADLVDDYGITQEQIEVALRYELRRP
jgi:uncharacterized protein (DUF433 family)